MSNKCINQLIISGDRKSIFDIITDNELNYKKNKVYEINKGTFCVVFISDWKPPAKYLQNISKQYPLVHLHIFFTIKLSNTKGHVCFVNGIKYDNIDNNAFGLSCMSDTISSNNFYIEGGFLTCSA